MLNHMLKAWHHVAGGIIILGILFIPRAGFSAVNPSQNARIEELRTKLNALEDYTQKLQASMNEFSKNLVKNVDQQLQYTTSRAVVISPVSHKVSRIDTNIGTFLISAQRIEKIDKGYRLYLQIGNPNAASYADIKLRIFWGTKWDSGLPNFPYEKWRLSLTGAEYVYSGLLDSGTWTEIAVDLKPADFSQVQYVECEMEANTVRLQKFRSLDSGPSSR